MKKLDAVNIFPKPNFSISVDTPQGEERISQEGIGGATHTLPVLSKKDISDDTTLLSCAEEIAAGRFLFVSTRERTSTYEIVDPELKVVREITEDFYFERQLAQGLAKSLGFALAPIQVRRAKELLLLNSSECVITEPPKVFDRLSEPGFVFTRLPFDELIPGPWDAWQEFTERLSDADAFKAFTWSMYESRHRGRQALCLVDIDGEAGKSTVLRALVKPFGSQIGAINKEALQNKRFLLKSLEGKRVTVYPDCKNPNFFMSEIFRNIVSGDRVPIEAKGKDSYSAELYIRVIVAANFEPAISSMGADKSRLIRVDLSPGPIKSDPTWEKRLEEQLPYFLYECEQVYKRLCPDHGTILISQQSKDLVDQSASEFEEPLDALFQRYLVLSPESEMLGTELHEAIFRPERMDNIAVGKFKQFLRRRYSIKVERSATGARRTVWRGLRLKNSNYRAL